MSSTSALLGPIVSSLRQGWLGRSLFLNIAQRVLVGIGFGPGAVFAADGLARRSDHHFLPGDDLSNDSRFLWLDPVRDFLICKPNTLELYTRIDRTISVDGASVQRNVLTGRPDLDFFAVDSSCQPALTAFGASSAGLFFAHSSVSTSGISHWQVTSLNVAIGCGQGPMNASRAGSYV